MSDIIINDHDSSKSSLPKSEATLSLSYPITVKFRKNNEERTEVIEHLTIRRIKGSDLEQMGRVKGEMEQMVILFTRLTGHPKLVFEEMDAVDIEEFGKVIERFLGKSQATGTTS